MPSKNKLSIYMIKDEFLTDTDIIQNFDDFTAIDNVGVVYVARSYQSIPSWAESFFVGQLNTNNIFTANARAVLIIRINVRENPADNIEMKTFAIVMGYGKNMLKENVIEERFGLKVILNTINPDSLRRISKINIGGNQKLSNEQLPLKSGINDFGLDINRDLVSNIAGVSDDDDYVSGIMAGSDLLSVSAEVDISNIIEFLKKTHRKYEQTTYKRNFAWIDQIQDVKDTRLVSTLNQKLIEAINNSSDDVWMAVPEIIEWSEIKGFKYFGQDVFDDIYIEKVRDSFRNSLTDIEQLKGKRIAAISNVDDSTKYNWMANKCIYGEIMHEGKAYCINSGKWYCVNDDFVNEVNLSYAQTQVSDICFDEFNDNHSSEHDYSESFTTSHSDTYILLDADNIAYGGGNSKVEVCDILSKDKEMIHIKPYSGSSTLSHLFNQATVTAELIKTDAEFLRIANSKIREVAGNDNFTIINRNNFKVVFGIITKYDNNLPKLPFFSKVSFRYTKQRLMAFGVEVSIKNIRNIKNDKSA